MSATTLLRIYLALAALDLAWALFLTCLNYLHVERHGGELPEILRGSLSPEEVAKASDYSKARMRLSLVSATVTTLIALAAVAAGFFGGLDRLLAGLLPGVFLQGAVFLGLVLALSSLLDLPFSLYSTFVLERRFGFNTTTFRTWLLDGLKGLALGLALGLPLLRLLYAFIDGAGGLWWLWAAVAFSAISLGLSILYPLFVAPLFNKFSPLPEGSLADSIRNLATRLGFRMGGIYVMDGSRRSRHSNAYFTGFGRAKRIVLFDTLIETMTEEEVLAVLAHEIGHEKKRHVLKTTAASIALSFAAFYLMSLMQDWPALHAAFGFVREGRAAPTKHSLLLILGLVSGPASFFLTPLFSAWSRRHEYEADRFSVDALGNPGPLSSALLRLNRENASNLAPHPLYSAWYYSHPTLRERLTKFR